MSDETPSPPLVAPPVSPASTTTTKTETVKTTVGGTNGTNGAEPSVIIVTQSKIALINQSQASLCAVCFTLALCVGFLAPLFMGGDSLVTSGELIGVASGVITGAALATRSATSRASDSLRTPTPPPSTTGATTP